MLAALAALGLGMLGLAVLGIVRPSLETSFAPFKYVSLYMLAAMLIVASMA